MFVAAHAQQQSTAALGVSTTVAPRCELGLIDDVHFGEIPQNSTAPVIQGFTVAVTCVDGTDYKLSFDAGQHRAGGMRRMAKGASVLAYRIFVGGNTSIEVGDAGIDDTYPFDPLNEIGAGVAQVQTFLATAYPGSAESSLTDTGTHSDLVTVKVSF